MVDEIGRTELVNALARAALMGARGNSGVILSQIVRGAAEELASRPGELIDPVLVAASMARAADAAYESVREPAEGTMLTVFREMAHSVVAVARPHGARPASSRDATDEEQDELLAEVLEEAVRDGEAAVDRTPEQLEVLRESGVVDAGAHGLVVIIAGIVAGLRGDIEAPRGRPPRARRATRGRTTRTAATATAPTSSSPATGLEGRSFVPLLEELGDSVLVVGDEATLKVHVHTDEPEDAVALFASAGEVSQLDVADMREQVAERDAPGSAPGAARWSRSSRATGCASSSRSSAPTWSTAARPSTPRSTTCSRRSTRSPAEEVLVLPNNPNVRDGGRARGRALRQGRPGRRTAPRSRPAWSPWSSSTPSVGATRTPSASAAPSTGSASARSRPRPATTRRAASRRATRSASSASEIVAWGVPSRRCRATMAEHRRRRRDRHRHRGRGRADPARARWSGHAPDGVELETPRRRPAPLLVAARRGVAATSPRIPGSPL